MATIIIDKVPPYDGEHGLDLTYFTNGELARIYDITGLRPVHLTDALIKEDPKLRVAFAVVALEREGVRVEWLEPFWHARPQQLLIDLTRGPGVAADEDADDPQPSPPANAPVSGEKERTALLGRFREPMGPRARRTTRPLLATLARRRMRTKPLRPRRPDPVPARRMPRLRQGEAAAERAAQEVTWRAG